MNRRIVTAAEIIKDDDDDDDAHTIINRKAIRVRRRPGTIQQHNDQHQQQTQQQQQEQQRRRRREEARNLTFGIINAPSEFFYPVKDGWERKCRKLKGVTCLYHTISTGKCADTDRVPVMREFIARKVDGIAIRPCFDPELEAVFEEAYQAGIPIVSFDTDHYPNASSRIAYVGTDQVFIGQTMARLLRQLRPEGGTFIAYPSTRTMRYQGFKDEIMRYNEGPTGTRNWVELDRNFSSDDFKNNDVYDQITDLARLYPTAFLTLVQTPMRHPNWTHFVDTYRNITYIGTDGADFQLTYLNQGYVDGLVGQIPHEFGSMSLQVLYDYATQGIVPDNGVVNTNLLAFNAIPVNASQLNEVNENLINDLKYLGYTCFTVVQLVAILCSIWTIYHRNSITVKASQPLFLCLITVGIMVLSSSLIPLTFEYGDEAEGPNKQISMTLQETRSIRYCMTIPWLVSTGFTLIFSAIISKTMRVNKLFNQRGGSVSRRGLDRLQVKTNDVLVPLVILMTSNTIVLICWTVMDPLMYVREEYDGTDYWNRPIATYGACRSKTPLPYLLTLGGVNLSAVALASWQAYVARSIQLEFSESKYIGLTVFSLSQALLTGVPVMFIVKNMPQAYYVYVTLMISLLCMAVLLFIFLPKMILQKEYSEMDEQEQQQMMAASLQNQNRHAESSSSSRRVPPLGRSFRRLSSRSRVPSSGSSVRRVGSRLSRQTTSSLQRQNSV